MLPKLIAFSWYDVPIKAIPCRTTALFCYIPKDTATGCRKRMDGDPVVVCKKQPDRSVKLPLGGFDFC
jgi:hypothetical protein